MNHEQLPNTKRMQNFKFNNIGGQGTRENWADCVEQPGDVRLFIDDFSALNDMPRQRNEPAQKETHDAYLSEIFRQNHGMGGNHLYPFVRQNANPALQQITVDFNNSNLVLSEEDLRQSLSPATSHNQRDSQLCTMSELREDRVLQASVNSQQTAYHIPEGVATPGVFVQDQNEALTGSFPKQFPDTTEESESNNPLQTQTIINLKTETQQSPEDGYDPKKSAVSNQYQSQIENKYLRPSCVGQPGLQQFLDDDDCEQRSYERQDVHSPIQEEKKSALQPLMINSTSSKSSPNAPMYRYVKNLPGQNSNIQYAQRFNAQSSDKHPLNVDQRQSSELDEEPLTPESLQNKLKPGRNQQQILQSYKLPTFSRENTQLNGKLSVAEQQLQDQLLQVNDEACLVANSMLLERDQPWDFEEKGKLAAFDPSVIKGRASTDLDKITGPQKQQIVSLLSTERQTDSVNGGQNSSSFQNTGEQQYLNGSGFRQCVDAAPSNNLAKVNEIINKQMQEAKRKLSNIGKAHAGGDSIDYRLLRQSQNQDQSNMKRSPEESVSLSLLNQNLALGGFQNASDDTSRLEANSMQPIHLEGSFLINEPIPSAQYLGQFLDTSGVAGMPLQAADKARSKSTYLQQPITQTHGGGAMSYNPSFKKLSSLAGDDSANPYQGTSPLVSKQQQAVNSGSQAFSQAFTAQTAACSSSQKSVSVACQGNKNGATQGVQSTHKNQKSFINEPPNCRVMVAPESNGNVQHQEDVMITNQKLMKELEKLRGEITQLKQLQMDQSNFQSRVARVVGNLSSTHTRNNLHTLSLSAIPSTQRSNSNISKHFEVGQFKSNQRGDSQDSKLVSKQNSDLGCPQLQQKQQHLQSLQAKMSVEQSNQHIDDQQAAYQQCSRRILDQLKEIQIQNQLLKTDVSAQQIEHRDQIQIKQNADEIERNHAQSFKQPRNFFDSSLDVAAQLEYGHKDREIEHKLIPNQKQQAHRKNAKSMMQAYEDQQPHQLNDFEDFVISSQTTSHLQQTPFCNLQHASNGLSGKIHPYDFQEAPLLASGQLNDLIQNNTLSNTGEDDQLTFENKNEPRSGSSSSFFMCNKLKNGPKPRLTQAQLMIESSLKKNRIACAPQHAANHSLKSTQITTYSQIHSTNKKPTPKPHGSSHSQRASSMNGNSIDTRQMAIISEVDQSDEHQQMLSQEQNNNNTLSTLHEDENSNLMADNGEKNLGMPLSLINKTAPSSMKMTQSRKMIVASGEINQFAVKKMDTLKTSRLIAGLKNSTKLVRSDSYTSKKAQLARKPPAGMPQAQQVRTLREFGQDFLVVEKEHSGNVEQKNQQKQKPPLSSSKGARNCQNMQPGQNSFAACNAQLNINDLNQFSQTFTDHARAPPEQPINEFDHHERIRDLFKDQLITAQSFLDLVSSKPPQRCQSGSQKPGQITAAKKPLIRLQSAKESNIQKANDVFQALQELKQQLELNGHFIQIERVGSSKQSHRSSSRNGSQHGSFQNFGFARKGSFTHQSSSFDARSNTQFVSNGSAGQTLDKLCLYDILVPNVRYKQQIEREAFLEENSIDKNAYIQKLHGHAARNQLYQIKSKMQQEQFIKQRIRLAVSSGQLMIKTGGGFKLFVDWLAEKRLII